MDVHHDLGDSCHYGRRHHRVAVRPRLARSAMDLSGDGRLVQNDRIHSNHIYRPDDLYLGIKFLKPIRSTYNHEKNHAK